MPTTTNLGLERPLNGTFVGTWDQPVNSNWDILDSVSGGVATVAITNINVTLSPAQYNCNFIVFNGTQTGNVVVTFPSIGRCWVVQNNCVSATSFVLACATAISTRYVALPPQEPVMIMSDGTNIQFVGLGRVGTYWDFAGTTVPTWVLGSNPNPYLNCDGTAFSSATYPALRDYLGAATLPDARGRTRFSLDQATSRLTGSSSLNGLNGNTLLAGGGSQTIGQTNIPNYALTVTDPTHLHGLGVNVSANNAAFAADIGSGAVTGLQQGTTISQTLGAATGITVNSNGSGSAYAPPGYVGGLTLIRAG